MGLEQLGRVHPNFGKNSGKMFLEALEGDLDWVKSRLVREAMSQSLHPRCGVLRSGSRGGGKAAKGYRPPTPSTKQA